MKQDLKKSFVYSLCVLIGSIIRALALSTEKNNNPIGFKISTRWLHWINAQTPKTKLCGKTTNKIQDTTYCLVLKGNKNSKSQQSYMLQTPWEFQNMNKNNFMSQN